MCILAIQPSYIMYVRTCMHVQYMYSIYILYVHVYTQGFGVMSYDNANTRYSAILYKNPTKFGIQNE